MLLGALQVSCRREGQSTNPYARALDKYPQVKWLGSDIRAKVPEQSGRWQCTLVIDDNRTKNSHCPVDARTIGYSDPSNAQITTLKHMCPQSYARFVRWSAILVDGDS